MAVIDVRWMTAFIDRPAATFEAAAEFWCRVTGTSLSSRRGDHDQFATLLPPTGDAHLRVQRLDAGPGGTHLDLHVAGDLGAACDRAESVGAGVVDRLDGVVVMSSPSGLPWCLVGHHHESRIAAPYAIDDGPATGVDQVCIDVAADRFDARVRVLGEAHRLGAATDAAAGVPPPGATRSHPDARVAAASR